MTWVQGPTAALAAGMLLVSAGCSGSPNHQAPNNAVVADDTAIEVQFSVQVPEDNPRPTPSSVARAAGGTACAAYLLNPISTGSFAKYEMFIQVPRARAASAAAAIRAEAPGALINQTERRVVPTQTDNGGPHLAMTLKC
jgi:hypothetical protein